MKLLILIRGVPGSGKTTLAKMLARDIHYPKAAGVSWFEADQWFTKSGVYRFNPKQLNIAHHWCQIQTHDALERRIETVIVSNCFIRHWEMVYYLSIAQQLGYKVQIIKVTGDFGSIHGVPQEKIDRMKANFED